MNIALLPTEILCEIAGSPILTSGDLARLNRCNRVFHNVTSPLLYQRCTLGVQWPEISISLAVLDAICAGKHQFVRELIFVGAREIDAIGSIDLQKTAVYLNQLWEMLEVALEKMDNLQKFHWAIPQIPHINPLNGQAIGLPKKLLCNASLRSLNIGFERDNEEKQFLPRTLGSSIPYGKEYMTASEGLFSLAISLEAGLLNEETLERFRSLILSSPDLKILRLTGELFNRLFNGRIQSTTVGSMNSVITPTTLELKPNINVYPYEGMDWRLSDYLFKRGPRSIDFTRIENLTINANFSQDWSDFFPPSKHLRKFRCVDDTSGMACPMTLELRRFLKSREGLEEVAIVGCGMRGRSGWSRDCFKNSAQTLRKLTVFMDQQQQDIMDWAGMFRNLQWVTIQSHRNDDINGRSLPAATPTDALSKQLESLSLIPSLRVLRFVRVLSGRSVDDPGIEDNDLYSEDNSNALQTIEAINTAKNGEWPNIRFICTIYCQHGNDWMEVWERTKKGVWLPPIKVQGRRMASRAQDRKWWVLGRAIPRHMRIKRISHGMGYRLGVEVFDAWDQWLEARI